MTLAQFNANAETDRLLRQESVEQMMIQHVTQRKMAEVLGVSPACINKDIKQIKQRWREIHAEKFQDYALEELAKLKALEAAMWPEAMEGKGYAVERVLQVMDHRAKIIGLYAPAQSKVQVITEDILDNAIADYQARLEQLTIEAGDSEPGEIEEARRIESGDSPEGNDTGL